jgi:hypothetical protein
LNAALAAEGAVFARKRLFPQSLKARIIAALYGTAEAVPYPKPIYAISSRQDVAFLVFTGNAGYHKFITGYYFRTTS